MKLKCCKFQHYWEVLTVILMLSCTNSRMPAIVYGVTIITRITLYAFLCLAYLSQ